MIGTAREPKEIQDFFDEYCAGKLVKALLVHGINSLKSVDPPLGAVGGKRVDAIDFVSPTIFTITIGGTLLQIDLQRAGVLRWNETPMPWSVGHGSMPTGQLLLASGGVDFVESSKTKRVTFRLSTT